MKKEFSPGPWTVQKLEDIHNGYADWPTFAIRSSQNVCLAVVGAVDHFQSERNEANAHIMAASRELYESLKELSGHAETVLRDIGLPHDNAMLMLALLDNANLALKRAEGGN